MFLDISRWKMLPSWLQKTTLEGTFEAPSQLSATENDNGFLTESLYTKGWLFVRLKFCGPITRKRCASIHSRDTASKFIANEFIV